MRIRCTIAGPDGETDACICAPAGTALRDLAGPLAQLCGASGPVFAGGRQLADGALLGSPPLIEGVSLRVGIPAPAPAHEDAPFAVHVVGGPAAGDIYPVTPGHWRIGRGAGADIRLDADPAVSRRHALLVIGAQGAVVRDTGSTNGSEVAGAPIGEDGAALAAESLLRLGDSTLALRAAAPAPTSVRPGADGVLLVNPPPRLPQAEGPVEVTLPAPPDPPPRTRIPLASTLLPLLLGAALAWWQPQFALFMLLSPLMVGANLVGDRVTARRRHRRLLREFDDAAAAARDEVDAALAAEATARTRAAPDAARLLTSAEQRALQLWERRRRDHDFLTVRLGTTDAPARLTVRSAAGAVEHPPLGQLPVTAALPTVGVLGVAGPRGRVEALTRFLIGQIAALHSPREARITVLTTRDPRAWAWARWLPHLRRDGDAVDIAGPAPDAIAARVARLVERIGAAPAEETPRGPATVVVLDDARALRGVPGIARLLAAGPSGGVHCICVAAEQGDLPGECTATAVIDGAGLLLAGGVDPPVPDATADLVSTEWSERLARALAPLRDATPDADSALPRAVRLLDLLGLPAPDGERVEARWRRRPRCTEAVIGVTAAGPYAVDLRADGPHGLIAGTTGAGKSQLLQTLVAALAAGNRPDELCFVLVDYKGGAAFADCARLPHTVGVVTDLDRQLTARALSSLDAELRRRERILAAAGCADLESYQRLGSPDGPLPRLVLAVDEFAFLTEELPDFVTGLVDVARRGRSLGLHLLLATQRPSGVVSAEIRANTALRVALRMADPGDSQDVIDAPLAATIPAGLPGRGYCRAGNAAPVQLQIAHLGGASDAPTAGIRVDRYDWRETARARQDGDGSSREPTDLSRLVDAIRAAAERLGAGRPHSPWLPPLPRCVTVDRLPPSAAGSDPGGAAARHRLAIGLLDLPAQQAQRPYELDLAAGGHLLVAGGPRSGRTTLLRTLTGAAGRLPVDDVHLYLLDCAGGGLLAAGTLPHVGAAVGADDADRGARVIDRLAGEVARRQALLARSGHGSLAEYHAAQPRELCPPWLLLLIDGWAGFVTAYDGIDHGRPIDTVLGLVREGAAAGLHVVVTGGREVLTGRLAALVRDRVVLPLADPGDYALAGIPPRQLPCRPGPGRGLLPGDPVTEVQVALLTADPAGSAQTAALQRIAAAAPPTAAHRRPWRVEPLPVDVAYAEPAAPAGGRFYAEVGVGGDDAARLGVDFGRFGPGFLVAGPRGSGRTTALVTMAASAAAHGNDVLLVASPRSGLAALAGGDRVHGPFPADGDDTLAAVLQSCGGPLCVVVDDAAGFLDTPIERPILDLLRDARRPAVVLVSGTVEELGGSYRGLVAEARRSGSGLLLNPSGPLAGDLLGVPVGRGHARLPGRGLLCLHGVAAPVQVARPPAGLGISAGAGIRAGISIGGALTPCADSASRWAG